MDNNDKIVAEAEAEFQQIVSDIKTSNKRWIKVNRIVTAGTVIALAAVTAVIVTRKNTEETE